MQTTNNWKEIFNKENRTKYFVHAISFLCIASIIVFVFLLIGDNSLKKGEGATAEKQIDYFADIELEAKGAMVWDVVNHREIFSQNADTPMPLASLTKVMTALVASENISDSSDIEISAEYLAPEGDSRLIAGDRWRTSDLRDFTLLTSSNDGAFALAAIAESKTAGEREDFIRSMNSKANAIGLLNSRFFNEHGLDIDESESGAYGSARDMAFLFEYAMKHSPEVLEATRYENMIFASAQNIYPAQNTNYFVDQVPNIIASKTGFTDLAGGNLVIAYDAGLNRPIIISVLGSSEEGRFKDALKLLEASMEEIQNSK